MKDVKITEAYAFATVLSSHKLRIVKAITEGQKVYVKLIPKKGTSKIGVHLAEGSQLIGYVMSSDENTYALLAKKEPMTNTVMDSNQLLAYIDEELKAEIIASPSVSVFKMFINLENVDVATADNATEAAAPAVVEDVKFDLSMFSDEDAKEVEARMKHIKKACSFSKKVERNVLNSFVQFMSSHKNIRHFDKPVFINNGGREDDAILHFLLGDNLCLTGPKGVGKNALVEHLSILFDLDLCDKQMSIDTSKEEMRGEPTFLDDGRIGVKLSNIVASAQNGEIVCLDEANMLRGSISSILHSATDHRRYIDVDGHGQIKVHEQTRFIITLNEGDEYEGTRQLNAAFRDRFHEIIFKPNPDGMKEVFKHTCGLNDKDASELSKLYNIIHTAVYSDSDEAIPEIYLSQRKFIRAGQQYARGFADTIQEAFRACVIDTIVEDCYREIANNLIEIHTL